MKEQEKAKEMYEEFAQLLRGDKPRTVRKALSDSESAKRCAIIACKNTIKALHDMPDLNVVGNVLLNQIEYYREVENELNEL